MRPAENPLIAALRAADDEPLFDLIHAAARRYAAGVDDRPVYPAEAAIAGLARFDEALPDAPADPVEALTLLHSVGSPATVAQTGGRYFGFVCGGALPIAQAARWLTDTWDQNPAMFVQSPVCGVIEQVVEGWLVDLLRLPAGTVAGFVSGCSTATFAGLATGRNMLLQNAGHDVFARGLFGAPPIKVVLGEGAHSTVYKALSMLGLGTDQITRVPADAMGRLRVDCLPPLDRQTLLVLQAGHVNTGGFDDFETLCAAARRAGAYVHVDGAFGLWAAASPALRHLTAGVDGADSWSVDGHKTLNAPYDNGICLSRHPEVLRRSMHMQGSYIIVGAARDSMQFTPEMSRRARAVDLWACLKGLGRAGVAGLVEELHAKARYFAELLAAGGLEVVNRVDFNQVLVRCATDALTEALVARVQASRVCWLGGARMHGRAVVRISVCSFRTTMADVEASAADILAQAAALDG